MTDRPARRALLRLQAAAVPLLLRGMRGLPTAVVVEALGLGGLIQACFEPRYCWRVLAWVRGFAITRRAQLRLAFEILLNRGRFLAIHAWPSLLDPEEFGRRTVLEGAEHVDAVRGRQGVILVGFHLGPAIARPVLAYNRYTTTTLRGRWRFRQWPAERSTWQEVMTRMPVIASPLDDPGARAIVLHRLRRLLLAGEMVRVTGDGEFGDVAFVVPVAGERLVVRAGWWVLRRQTGAPVLPVLTRWSGSRVVVTVCPPLPPPVADPTADLLACRNVLEPILQDYARRFPDQCLALFRTSMEVPSEAIGASRGLSSAALPTGAA